MFRASSPVTASAFFDREKEINEILAAFDALEVGAPRWLALLGRRKIGKTSLLLEASRRSRKVRVVVLDVLERTPISLEFFRALAAASLDALMADDAGGSFARVLHDPAAFRDLLYASELAQQLPRSVKRDVDSLPMDEVDGNVVRRWLNLPEELARLTEQKLVIAIDEVQELGSLATKKFEPFHVMRAAWQRHENVAYIISGSAPSMLKELLSSRHSPFFMHFSLMELGPFEELDAIELLQKSAPKGRSITRKLARRVAGLVGGHPFYLQMVGEALTALEPPYDEDSLKPVVQQLLFSKTGRLSLYFENEYRRAIGRASTLAATMQAVAELGPTRLTDVARQIGASTASTARYLERLGDLVVRGEGGLYELADPLMTLWIRWRSPGGTVIPMTVVGDEAEISVARHLASLGFDLVYQSRASRGAFDLLAVRGGDQLGLQVKRSPLPVRFRKTEWSRMKQDAQRWGWHWCIARVDESGAVQILDAARARIGREVRLAEDSEIDNLLKWLDEVASKG